MNEIYLKLAMPLHLPPLFVVLTKHKGLEFFEPDTVRTSAKDPLWIF
jgi:hypothetical protein